MQDNRETNPDIILAQTRLKRNQRDLNIELALSDRTNPTPGGGGSGGGSSPSSGGISNSIQTIEDTGGSGEGTGRINCFLGSTYITMSDGEKRPIYAIPSGMSVLAPDETGKLKEGRIVGKSEKFYTDWIRVTFSDKHFVEVRPKHRYRSDAGMYVPVREATHALHRKGGDWVKVQIVERQVIRSLTPRLFYNLEIEGYGTYLANDDWVSNAKIEDANIS